MTDSETTPSLTAQSLISQLQALPRLWAQPLGELATVECLRLSDVLALLAAQPEPTQDIKTEALTWLNENFRPWTFDGSEPVFASLLALLAGSAPTPSAWQHVPLEPPLKVHYAGHESLVAHNAAALFSFIYHGLRASGIGSVTISEAPADADKEP